MQTIWKYPLDIRTEIMIPTGAKILCVHVQNDRPCLWAQVDPKAVKEKRTFKIYGTGHEMFDACGTYVGTFMTDGGAFVWHVYEDFFKIEEIPSKS